MESQIVTSITKIPSFVATASSQASSELASQPAYTEKKRSRKPKNLVVIADILSENERPLLRKRIAKPLTKKKSRRNNNGVILGRPAKVGSALTLNN